ncbi:MAG TPA: cupin domain-containing protein [Candidatus Acidoferrales bacterium]|nr:cupin domain-containing protein [Candidatus Acidoferrales bacterium]
MVELVAYQECSVVSRTLVKRDSGNVTLFAFDEGQGLSEHTAPFDALVQILEGEAEITISGKPPRDPPHHAVCRGEILSVA